VVVTPCNGNFGAQIDNLSPLPGTKHQPSPSYSYALGMTYSQHQTELDANPWLALLAGGFAKFIMDNGENLSRRLERRWAPRYSFRADLEIEWGSAVLTGKTRDISSNGMFIEAADTLWIGAGFMARLNVDPPMKVECSVKRVEPGLGMGVSMAVAESDHQKYYQDLLVSLAGNPPGTAL
jgi:hypothetical protein